MTTTLESIPAEVVGYLRLHHIITLSTASFTGMPHANTVAYANSDLQIFFAASDSSNVARNMAANHYVSFTIDDYTTDWRKVRELQGVGRCFAADAIEAPVAHALFTEKFGHPPTEEAGTLFAIRPHEMHFVDYTYTASSPFEPARAPEITSRRYAFDGLDAAPLHGAISTALDRRAFGPGEIVFRPGDAAGRYYVVIEGEVEIRGEGYGADQTVTRVGPGQMFGDHAALRGQRGAMTAHAVSATVLLEVEREAIRDLLMPKRD